MVDLQLGKRIEKGLARQGRDYALDHRALLPDDGAEVLEIGVDPERDDELAGVET